MEMIASLNIGKVKTRNNLFLAPMAGITDSAFRTLAVEAGAGLVYTEMVSARALCHGNEKTLKLLKMTAAEHPVSVQIFGSEPADFEKAARIVRDHGADLVDINLGCPAKKIVKTGAGSRLMGDLGRIEKIISAAVNSVAIPVTVKIRTGVDPSQNLAPELSKIAENAGAKMVAVHARCAASGHAGAPELDRLAEAVASVKIPVIGNGGIDSEAAAKEFFDRTGCAGIMIGRAAIGDPEIFKRIEHFLETGEILPRASWETRLGYLTRHAEMSVADYGPETGVIVLRKLGTHYFKGLPNSKMIREKFNHLSSLEELKKLIELVYESKYFDESVSDE
jgi:tRNA-dihydrouridine synthase B